MSYASIETSAYSALKIVLVQVSFGNNHWYMTNHTEVVNFSARLWQPVAGLAHDDIPDAMNFDNSKLAINLPVNHEIADVLKLGSPGGQLLATIWHGHVGGDFVRVWQGKITDRKTEYPYFMLVTDSILASAKRLAAGFVVSVSCPHTLYETECGVNKADYAVAATVASVNGLEVTLSGVASLEPGYLIMGYVTWPHPTLLDIAMSGAILNHVGNVITLAMPAPTLAVGTAITAYPNCNKERDGHCLTRFNNTVNHGGIPVTGRNPFQTFRLF